MDNPEQHRCAIVYWAALAVASGRDVDKAQAASMRQALAMYGSHPASSAEPKTPAHKRLRAMWLSGVSYSSQILDLMRALLERCPVGFNRRQDRYACLFRF